MHHSNNHNATFTYTKKNAERKGANQATPHLPVNNGIQKGIYFDSSRTFFYRTNKALTEMLLLAIIELSSCGNLRDCSG